MTFRPPKEGQAEKRIKDEKEAFYHLLGFADPASIRLLVRKISPDINKAAFRAGLTVQDGEELINDAVVITVSNIRNGKFQFQDYHPSAYALGVARKLIANRIKKKSPRTEELSNIQAFSDFSPETYLKDKERQTIVGELLGRLGENCRSLLEMKFYRQLKDEEIISKQLAPYTSVGSLKSKRSQCLKKLAEIAKEAGIEGMF